MRSRATSLGLDVSVREVSRPLPEGAGNGESLPVLPIPLARPAEPGRPDPANAAAVIAAIETGVALVREGQASALVTNPINKHVLYEAGFAHPGHTEFLGVLAEAWGESCNPVMMLAADVLKVVPVTVHIPLREVASALTEERILRTVETVAGDLVARFGIEAPRIAISGLNPHAGEGGAMGEEETTIIGPAIERLLSDGHKVTGPHSADTMFHAAARAAYDVAIAMYHDQALIPIKALAFERAVNVTLGLPFIRTSPDHGTAYELAATGKADPSSLIHALQLASELALGPGSAK